MGKQYVFWTARQESKGKRNDGPRTVGMRSENGGYINILVGPRAGLAY